MYTCTFIEKHIITSFFHLLLVGVNLNLVVISLLVLCSCYCNVAIPPLEVVPLH